MANDFEKDTIMTSAGPLYITFIGHGTLLFEFSGKIIHIDPALQQADYDKMPAADIIMITHHHGDHFDKAAINKIVKEGTKIYFTKKCSENAGDFENTNILANGDAVTEGKIKIEAVPAYNLEHKRPGGEPFHPKGEGNGYVFTFGDIRVYVAGDTENVPEMKNLKNIDIAFLPMNLPYTMTPEMTAAAAISFMPKILYPYHYGDSDTFELLRLLQDEKDIEVRIRQMK